MNQLQYHLFPKNKNGKETFDNLVSTINTYKGVGANIEENTGIARIFYENSGMSSTLKLDESDNTKIILECEKADPVSIDMLRFTVKPDETRIYSPTIEAFLPRDVNLKDCSTIQHKGQEGISAILQKASLKPAFWMEGSYTYFARQEKDNTIHIVNDNLLYHFVNRETYVDTPELSYKVADNIQDFVAKYDCGLIPTDFYRYYKRSFKIIDYSGFDLHNPGRKVFIKPIIYEFNNQEQTFMMVAHEGSPILVMDKIRKEETLNDSILRILKDEISVATDYIGAVVTKVVEFDLDRDNILTPRLIVYIYIDKAQMTEEQKNKKDRNWISPSQVKDFKK